MNISPPVPRRHIREGFRVSRGLTLVYFDATYTASGGDEEAKITNNLGKSPRSSLCSLLRRDRDNDSLGRLRVISRQLFEKLHEQRAIVAD